MTSTCGSHDCGCSDAAATTAEAPVARISGIALHAASVQLPADMLRQRACTELLRQQAQRQGLLAQDDEPGLDGATSAAASQAIEQLLERELRVPGPSEQACQRYHAAHPGFGGQGESVHLRHVLFAVTPGVDVALLRQRADLGWLTPEDCAPEFAREVFGSQEVGVLARLVHSRFGLHVVQVCARKAAKPKAFDEVQASIALVLRQQAWVNALRQYLQLLAGSAEVEGVQLDAADSPLVQ